MEIEINKFKRELFLRKYSQATIETYTSCLKVVFQKCDGVITLDKVKNYILTIQNRNYHKQIVATVRNYFYWVLKLEISLNDLPYPRREEKLPEILSVSEIQKIISVNKIKKHQAIICLLYGGGLRVSELINLKLKDIDSERMIINIVQAKGRKDRITPLTPTMLNLLRKYYKEYKPKEYLFNGKFELKYSAKSCNEIVKKYLGKNYHFHLLRHSCFTNLTESGVDIRIIQKLAGHSSCKTTEIYTHVSKRRVTTCLF